MKLTKNHMLSTLAASSLATAYAPAAAAYGNPYGDPNQTAVPVQTELVATDGQRLALPLNGSNCDPRVISQNLAKLRASGVLQNALLTVTVPVASGCYRTCATPADMQKALQQHCGKAEKLAQIVQVVQRP